MLHVSDSLRYKIWTDGRDDLAQNRNSRKSRYVSRNIKCRIRHAVVTKTCHRCIFMKATVRISLGNVLGGGETEDPTSLFQLRADKRAIAAPRDLPTLLSFSRALPSIFLVSRLLIPPESPMLASEYIGKVRKRGRRDGCGAGRDQNQPRALRNLPTLRNYSAACTRGACRFGPLDTCVHVHRMNVCPSTCCAGPR